MTVPTFQSETLHYMALHIEGKDRDALADVWKKILEIVPMLDDDAPVSIVSVSRGERKVVIK